jgi:hypothetical protein
MEDNDVNRKGPLPPGRGTVRIMVTNAVSKDSVLLTGLGLKLSTALKAAQSLSANGPPVTFRGSNASQPQLVQAISTALAPYQAALSAHVALTQAVALRKQSDAASKALLSDLQAAIAAAFGSTSTVFQQFGFKTRKAATPLTSSAKVVKAQKALSTRAARGTLGSKQRKAVTGSVTAPVVVDPSTRSVVASTSSQAPSNGTSPSTGTTGTTSSSTTKP